MLRFYFFAAKQGTSVHEYDRGPLFGEGSLVRVHYMKCAYGRYCKLNPIFNGVYILVEVSIYIFFCKYWWAKAIVVQLSYFVPFKVYVRYINFVVDGINIPEIVKLKLRQAFCLVTRL